MLGKIMSGFCSEFCSKGDFPVFELLWAGRWLDLQAPTFPAAARAKLVSREA